MINLTPYLPRDDAKDGDILLLKCEKLLISASRLSGNISPTALNAIKDSLLLMNNYYSNEIESEGTHPISIEAAKAHRFSSYPEKRDKQYLALAYAFAQSEMRELVDGSALVDFTDVECIKQLHKNFYSFEGLPESFLTVASADGKVSKTILPGQVRDTNVIIGKHLVIESDQITSHLKLFSDHYRFKDSELEIHKIIKVMAAHHRFMHIHPFLDGNGRIGRLMTDAMFYQIKGLNYDLWSISRGLSLNTDNYKAKLARADQVRQGEYDGRGLLTQSGLVEMIDFMIDTALEQVNYMARVLNIETLEKRIKNYIRNSRDGMYEGVKAYPDRVEKIVLELLVKGQIAKSELSELLGCSERKARSVANELIDMGFLKNKGKFETYQINLPSHMIGHVFLDIFPLTNMEDERRD